MARVLMQLLTACCTPTGSEVIIDTSKPLGGWQRPAFGSQSTWGTDHGVQGTRDNLCPEPSTVNSPEPESLNPDWWTKPRVTLIQIFDGAVLHTHKALTFRVQHSGLLIQSFAFRLSTLGCNPEPEALNSQPRVLE